MDSRAKIAVGLIVLVLLLPILVESSYADDVLKLPPTSVTIEASDGTQSHFDTLLSNVPPGYDVSNSRYNGWCVDRRYALVRSPVTHDVILYSSLSPPVMANESWDMVNYVLNHKQGAAQDVQQAIWYFVDLLGPYAPSTNASWAMVNEALANGKGFAPIRGQAVAVICYPMQADVQVTIIEVGGVSYLDSALSLVLVSFGLATPLVIMVYRRIRKRNREANHVGVSYSYP